MMTQTLYILLIVMIAGTISLEAADDARTLAQRHVDVIRTGDVDKLVADYAEDAVALTPPGLFSSRPADEEGIASGKAEIKKLFELLCGPKFFTAVKGMDARIEKLRPAEQFKQFLDFRFA